MGETRTASNYVRCSCRGVREDIDKEDDQESYFRWLEENPTAGLPIADEDDDDRELQYDDDGMLPPLRSSGLILCLIRQFNCSGKIQGRIE